MFHIVKSTVENALHSSTLLENLLELSAEMPAHEPLPGALHFSPKQMEKLCLDGIDNLPLLLLNRIGFTANAAREVLNLQYPPFRRKRGPYTDASEQKLIDTLANLLRTEGYRERLELIASLSIGPHPNACLYDRVRAVAQLLNSNAHYPALVSDVVGVSITHESDLDGFIDHLASKLGYFYPLNASNADRDMNVVVTCCPIDVESNEVRVQHTSLRALLVEDSRLIASVDMTLEVLEGSSRLSNEQYLEEKRCLDINEQASAEAVLAFTKAETFRTHPFASAIFQPLHLDRFESQERRGCLHVRSLTIHDEYLMRPELLREMLDTAVQTATKPDHQHRIVNAGYLKEYLAGRTDGIVTAILESDFPPNLGLSDKVIIKPLCDVVYNAFMRDPAPDIELLRQGPGSGAAYHSRCLHNQILVRDLLQSPRVNVQESPSDYRLHAIQYALEDPFGFQASAGVSPQHC